MASSKLFTLLAAASLAAVSSFLAVGCAAPTADDAEALGETEEHQLAGTRLTPSQVATYLRNAGFAESAIGKMVCTAKYESSYYEKATNKNKNGSTDYGLFQVNSLHLGKTANCPSSGSKLFDPATNAKCALSIFKSQGINAWYGYKKHKSECDRTKAPGSAAVPAADDNDDTTTSSSGSTTVPLPVPRPTDIGTSSGSTGSGTDSSEIGDGTDATTQTPDEQATIDPDADYDLGAGCWSATKQDTMPPLSCVQQTGSNVWFQCKEGKWYRGGDDVTGPYGYCNGAYPLAQ